MLKASLISLAAALSLLVLGCQTKLRCEPLTRCGGDFLTGAVDGQKEWVVKAQDACMDQLQPPLNPVSLAQQPPKPNGRKMTGQATYDWCSNLQFKPDGSVSYQGYFPVIPIKNGTLKFEGDRYEAHFLTFAKQQLTFPAACRAAQGVPESCPLLGRRIDESIRAESNVAHMRCSDDDEGGCFCEYDLTLFTGAPGTWGTGDGLITFYDTSNAPSPPAPADYCVKDDGNTLQLTGHNGQHLFNRFTLRTLELHPVSCSDGVQDQGEKGVDCEGPCDAVCPTCEDGMQNGDEEGVDCNGACRDVCQCFNQAQDPWEDGVDCGGPCALDCACTNGQKDATEEKVDCGGDCVLRYGQGAGEPKACE